MEKKHYLNVRHFQEGWVVLQGNFLSLYLDDDFHSITPINSCV